MEKPVRIEENERIRTFNDKVRHGLEHALNFMLGTEEKNKIQISYFDPFLMPVEAYLSVYKKKSVLIKIIAEKAYEGELYWFFEINTAIILGSLMRLITPSAMAEKLAKEDFDASDSDSFGEVGNQLCGILDRAFRGLTKKNIHLKMDFKKKVYPDESIELSTFVNKEEYVVLLSSITIPNQGTQKLTLLLPRTLYEVLLNMEIQLKGITPKTVLLHTWNEDLAEEIQKQFNTRYTKLTLVNKPEELIAMADKANVAAVAVDLQTLNFPLSQQESILIKRLAANRALGKLPFFFSYPNPDGGGVAILQELGFNADIKASLKLDFLPWCQQQLKAK